jgi:hypothetical protein
MAGRLVHVALGAASREIRRDVRNGARWADAHLVGKSVTRAEVFVDTSIGFDEGRHPRRGKAPRPPTVIVVEVG